jgi:hypothetical protein
MKTFVKGEKIVPWKNTQLILKQRDRPCSTGYNSSVQIQARSLSSSLPPGYNPLLGQTMSLLVRRWIPLADNPPSIYIPEFISISPTFKQIGLELTNNTWNPSQYTQTNVDEQINAASRLQEHREKRQEDSHEIEEDVGLVRCISTPACTFFKRGYERWMILP